MPMKRAQAVRTDRFSDAFIDGIFSTVNTQGVIENYVQSAGTVGFGDPADTIRLQMIAAITGSGSPTLPPPLAVVSASGQNLATADNSDEFPDDVPPVGEFREIINEWRMFVFRLAAIVVALFDMKDLERFMRSFFRQVSGRDHPGVLLWEPILEKWSGALGLISLTAARNHFVDKLVSLDVVRNRCRSDSRNRDSPAPISPIRPHNVEFWSDSTAGFHYRTDNWSTSTWTGHSSNWSKKRYPFPSALATALGAGGGGQLGRVAPGGTLVDLLKYLETQEQADARMKLNRSKTLVVVWSFNDFFAEKSPGNR